MSYFSDHPEQYDEICRRGIAVRIYQAMIAVGYDPAGNEEDLRLILETIVLAIQDDPDGGKAYDGLLDWSVEQISREEQDYFGGLVDDAMERGKP